MTDLTILAPDGPYRVFFSHDELADNEGNGALNPTFREKLTMLRLWYGKPMVVNSCCRTIEYNKEIGGHPKSLHVWDYPARDTRGACAIDINGVDAHLVQTALQYEWSVGVYSTFVHLDCRHVVGLPRKVFRGLY